MGQQYIETVAVYGSKTTKKEYPSEIGAYLTRRRNRPTVIDEIIDMIFLRQYGIWYYEPASQAEADLMIAKFEEKIAELKKKYGTVP